MKLTLFGAFLLCLIATHSTQPLDREQDEALEYERELDLSHQGTHVSYKYIHIFD